MEEPSAPLIPSWRLVYGICSFFILACKQFMTTSPSYVIMCMNKRKDNETSRFDVILPKIDLASTDESFLDKGELDWTNNQQWVYISSFYYGYAIVQPFAGRLADRFGGKIFLIIGFMGESTMFFMFPFMARRSYALGVTSRALQGFLDGFTIPCVYQLFTVWAHQKERSVLLPFAFAGYTVGSLFVFPLTHLICRGGWYMVYHVLGGIALTLGFLFQFLIYNSLESHPWISKREKEYLTVIKTEKLDHAIPWKTMFTSAPVLSFIVTHMCNSYGIILLNFVIPKYLKSLDFSYMEVGYFGSIFYCGTLTGRILILLTIRKFFEKSKLSLTAFRRLAHTLSNIMTSVIFIIVAQLGPETRILILCLIYLIGIPIDIAYAGAYWVSCIDVAPAFAGMITGIANCLSTCTGIVIPFIIKALVDVGTSTEYGRLFYTSAFSFFLATVIYGIYGTSEKQDWGVL